MIFTVTIALILSLFSTAVMSYISMATPIGPWIGPTLILIAMPLFRMYTASKRSEGLALSAIAGSVGGIIATAFGFSFPTLFFLDPTLFAQWMSKPLEFCLFLASFTIVAGLCALWIVDYYEKTLIEDQALAFPIGHVMHSMITVQKETKKAYELVMGVVSTFVFCFLQDGIGSFKGLIPKTIPLVSSQVVYGFPIGALKFDVWPMLWAIGFITGHVIAIPLAVGAGAHIALVSPLHYYFFNTLTMVEFTLAFCSGMVVVGALWGFAGLPRLLKNGIQTMYKTFLTTTPSHAIAKRTLVTGGFTLVATFLFLNYFSFSYAAQFFLLLTTFIWSYQIVVVAGKIGLATLGRYATFVMIPAMILFKLNSIQIVIVATFVELVGGIAVDLLFGRKLGALSNLSSTKVRLFQYLGILVCAASIGIVFWLLISHFGLGTAQLVAYRAQSRHLLIAVQHFDYGVLALGALFGLLLKYLSINPALALGGLLMPFNLSLGLIFGGFCTYFVKKPAEWEPFFSGVFACNALWMLLKVFI